MLMRGLSEEIQKPTFAGLSDRQIAATLNEQTIVLRPFTPLSFASLVTTLGVTVVTGIMMTIKALGATNPLYEIVYNLLLTGAGSLDVDGEIESAYLGQLLSDGVVTAEQLAQIRTALGQQACSRAEQLLGAGASVTEQDIADLRTLEVLRNRVSAGYAAAWALLQGEQLPTWEQLTGAFCGNLG